jgi:hypothetical protein
MIAPNLYKEARAAGYPARHALDVSRTVAEWRRAEDAGVVRLRLEPDYRPDMVDELVEGYQTRNGHDIGEDAARKACAEDLDRLGVWGTVGEYAAPVCPHCGAGGDWEQADSCWGHAGYRNPDDWRENWYVPDIMAETLDAARKAGVWS